MDGACSTHEKRNAYRVLLGKPEGMRRVGKPKRKWKDNIVMHMTIARQRLSKRVPVVTLTTMEGRPLLGKGSLNTFPQQRRSTQ
jgi:hypothetical protein